MLDTTNLLLTFAGLNGALTCLTFWKISREESKKGRKLAWNLSFQKQLKRVKKPIRTPTTRKRKRRSKSKPRQKGVDILPPQYNLPRDENSDEESPYLEGEWKVIE